MNHAIVFDKDYFAFQDALRQAETLAYANADSHAVIYRLQDGERRRLFVRMAADAAPDGAEVMTTVSRKPPEVGGSGMSLANAVQHMVANLPAGINLADHVLIEYFPERQRWGIPQQPREVFAYEFMSTDGLNIGTWIPSVSTNGVNFQPGFEGRGRVYGLAHQGRRDIGRYIEAALVTDENPGDCSERYRNGWTRAEASLRHGASPYDDGPPNADDETWTGYIDRFALERTIRMGRDTSKAGREAAAGAPKTAVAAGVRRHRP
jgi:hypothetical protein